MKVILRSDVQHVGRKHDIVDVATGFARNHLIPRKLADYATEAAAVQAEARRAKEEEERQAQLSELRTALETYVDKGVSIEARANDQGHLFAAIHENDIAEALSKVTGSTVPASVVKLKKEIKDTGTYSAGIVLGDETREIPVTVVADVDADEEK